MIRLRMHSSSRAGQSRLLLHWKSSLKAKRLLPIFSFLPSQLSPSGCLMPGISSESGSSGIFSTTCERKTALRTFQWMSRRSENSVPSLPTAAASPTILGFYGPVLFAIVVLAFALPH